MAKRTKRLTAQGDEKDEVRINKFLSEAGLCSRREADRYILEGKVKIDGVIARTGSKVTKISQVLFCDKPVKKEEKLVLIAFNKPEGIVCTADQKDPDNIIDYIDYGMRIYPIGRLDKDSEGLILLTNDGNIVNRILRAENNHEKEYIVTVNKDINADFMKAMSSGVPILNTVTNPCTVKQIDKNSFNIILTQGLNRQIRRMCEALGYKVTNLIRIRIMNIHLGRLKTGDFRNVTEKEIEELNISFQLQTNNRERSNLESNIESNIESNVKSNVKSNNNKNVIRSTGAKSAVAKSNSAKSNSAKSDYTKSATAKGDYTKRAAVKSDYTKSATAKGEYTKRAAVKSGYTQSATAKDDYTKRAATKSDYTKSATAKGDYTKRATVKSDYTKSPTAKGDYTKSATVKSDYTKSATAKDGYTKRAAVKSDYSKKDKDISLNKRTYNEKSKSTDNYKGLSHESQKHSSSNHPVRKGRKKDS